MAWSNPLLHIYIGNMGSINIDSRLIFIPSIIVFYIAGGGSPCSRELGRVEFYCTAENSATHPKFILMRTLRASGLAYSLKGQSNKIFESVFFTKQILLTR